MRRVVIVGGGLGGLRAAESLRSAGYSDAIAIVGDEVDEGVRLTAHCNLAGNGAPCAPAYRDGEAGAKAVQ